jgi:hypothetical protein
LNSKFSTLEHDQLQHEFSTLEHDQLQHECHAASVIFPPHSHCAFPPSRKISALLSKTLLFQFFVLFSERHVPEVA